MTQTITRLLFVFSLSLVSTTLLLAQSLSADRFLERLSAGPVVDEVEQDQSSAIYQNLYNASPAEVKRVLPSVLQHTRGDNEARVRGYATLFLTAIAMRPDGAALLSACSEEISSLILDTNPEIQRGALAAMDWVIGKPETNGKPYMSALQGAVQKPEVPQDTGVEMIGPLLSFGGSDRDVLKAVLAFLQRDDLTASTRMALVHELGADHAVPEEINQYLVKLLDDPEPHVRAQALVDYSISTSAYHSLGKDRVQRIANDPQEIQGIRELAKEAMAGKTILDPNFDAPSLVLDPKTGAVPQKPKDE
jgi:hypothetical protein